MVTLAIGAHPDDIEFGCSGYLAQTEDVHMLIFTAGEISGDKQRRIMEAQESASIIGAKITILDYPDGNVPVDGDIVNKLRLFIEEMQPETILVLSPYDTHQDHRNVSKITLSACRSVPTVLFYEVPTTHSGFSPNYFMDITEVFDIKRRALECFQTQMSKPYLNISEIEGLAKYRAYNCFKPDKLFEGFILHKHVILME